MSAKRFKIKIGNSKCKRNSAGVRIWEGGYCKPGGKMWKRVANRATRYSFTDGGGHGSHKKNWGPIEWP
jgi:hypothetical protein